MSTIIEKVSEYIHNNSMDKVAISNAKIMAAIEKRYGDIERKGNNVYKGLRQQKTYKQLLGMRKSLNARMGEQAADKILDEAPYVHAIKYNDATYNSITHNRRGGSSGFYQTKREPI